MGWQDMFGGGENPLDSFPMKKPGQGSTASGGQGDWWKQPVVQAPPPVIAPLQTSQQMPQDDGTPPGWGFLRAYLGK